MHRKTFTHVLLLVVALMIGAATGPPRIVEAQFIDRIVRPCTAGIVTLASVIVNPANSGNINVTPCTGGSLTVNGAAVIPGGVTCTGCTIGTIPYFSAANALANSPITRVSATEIRVVSLQMGTASSATGTLVLNNTASAFGTTIQAGNAAAARTYTWPTNFGAAGTVLTDAAGNGTLSWTAPGACATCVTSAAALTSTAIVTGAGGQAAQTPSATTTLSSAGNLVLAGIQTIAVGATTSAATDLLINPTTKASGNLIDARVNSLRRFDVTSAGIGSFLDNTHTITIAPSFTGGMPGIGSDTNLLLSVVGVLQLNGTTSAFPAIKRNGTAIDFRLADDSAYGSITFQNAVSQGSIVSINNMTAKAYLTDTNCADSAGAAACGSASAGAFVIDAGTTSTVVSTTSVTANSEIFVTFDASLGTRLSVTCNTTAALPYITARTAATSFTVTVAAGPAVNPACYSYRIVN